MSEPLTTYTPPKTIAGLIKLIPNRGDAIVIGGFVIRNEGLYTRPEDRPYAKLCDLEHYKGVACQTTLCRWNMP